MKKNKIKSLSSIFIIAGVLLISLLSVLGSNVKLQSLFSRAAERLNSPIQIFTDNFLSPFVNECWGDSGCYSVTTAEHYTGTAALDVNLNHYRTTQIYEQNDATFAASSYNTLEFDLKGSSGVGGYEPSFHVALLSNHYTATGSEVSVVGNGATYVPTFTDGQWHHVQIPFTAFQLEPTAQITGLSFRSEEADDPSRQFGHVYFDNIQFSDLADTTPPTITAGRNADLSHIALTFSENVDANDVQTVNNYSITSPDDSNYSSAHQPTQASLDPSQTVATLTMSPTLINGKHYVVTVNNIHDLAGNAIANNSSVTLQAVLQTATLNINASQNVHAFGQLMHGADLATWMHAANSGKPYPGDIPIMTELAKQAKVGFLRNSGGNWANSMVWDRSNSLAQWHDYTQYNYYNAAMMDSLATLRQQTGAEVLIQVNLCGVSSSMLSTLSGVAYPHDSNHYPSDLDMWKDFFHYTNVEHNYGFHYVELGSENNYDECSNLGRQLTPQEVANKSLALKNALLTVDPSLKFISPATAGYGGDVENPGASDDRFTPVINALGNSLTGLAWHFYQSNEGYGDNYCDLHDLGPDPNVLFNYNTYIVNDPVGCHGSAGQVISDDDWMLSHRRRYPEVALGWSKNIFLRNYPNTLNGITEINTLAGAGTSPLEGNHISAIWFADMLGRLGHAGYDFNTMYDLYDGSSDPAGDSYYGMIYPDNDTAVGHIYVRPTYYTYMMYGKLFGNQIVQSTTSDPLQKVTAWASTDSTDPGKVKLMVTNMSDSYVNATFNVSGLNVVDGIYYELTNPIPLATNRASATNGGGELLNGMTIDTSSVSAVQNSINNIITHPLRLTNIGTSFTHGLPAYSATSIILSNQPFPSMSPQPTNTPMPSVSPTLPVTPTLAPTATRTPTPSPTRAPSPTSAATGTPVPTPTGTSGSMTITFDNYPNSNPGSGDISLTGQYPSGVIRWGSYWITSGPWAGFTTRSLTFQGNKKQATFSFITPRKIVSVKATDPYGSTVTITCDGTSISRSVPANRNGYSVLSTGWTNTCTNVTIKSSGGDTTNFDDLVIQ